jgi:hypothetical protein
MAAHCYRVVVGNEVGAAYARAFEGTTIEIGSG